MSEFIGNIKTYMQNNHIKQSYIVLMTGWDKSMVSRMLSEDNRLKEDEMETLASVFGKSIDFFEDIVRYNPVASNNDVKFLAGTIDSKDAHIANKLVEMLRYYDAIINP